MRFPSEVCAWKLCTDAFRVCRDQRLKGCWAHQRQ